MSNSFICTDKGFVKNCSKHYSSELNQMVQNIEYTDKLRDALRLTRKQAESNISKYNLNAFVWNPFTEQPIRDKYRVVQARIDYINKANHYVVEPVKMISNSDVKFLTNSLPTEYLDYDDAVKLCLQKNEDIVEKIKNVHLELVK
jgi:hypothetical protein